MKCLILSLVNMANAQSKPVYQLFQNNGEFATYNEMFVNLSNSDMVFYGEYHFNPISHWMQLEISKILFDVMHFVFCNFSEVIVHGVHKDTENTSKNSTTL